MSELTEKSLEDALIAMKANDEPLFMRPESIIIPENLRQFLASEGYDTQEKIIELVNQLLGAAFRIDAPT